MTSQENEIVFAITKYDLQYEAKEKIGRELTGEEIEVAKKGLQFGLLTDIDTVYETIFTDIVSQ